MAITKRVIVLEQLGSAPLIFRVALWADVPAARQPFHAQKQAASVSAWKDASAADNAALQAGAVTERVDTVTFPPGTNLAAAQAALAAAWAAFQAEVNAYNPWNRYGSIMDASNAWTMTGVV